jgi:glycosyltransferase involved in cell wall biosynthesis
MAFTSAATPRLITEHAAENSWRQRLLAALQRNRAGDVLAGLWQKYWLPVEALRLSRRIEKYVREFHPDLCHAFPLPIEGYVGGLIDFHPMLISTWGQDLVNFSPRTWLHRRLTKRAFSRADAYSADCRRDLRLAAEMGMDIDNKPSAVFPGNGGIDLRDDHDPTELTRLRARFGARENDPLILYPRGVRGYVRLDTVWDAIPRVLDRLPHAKFVLMGVQGHVPSETRARESGVTNSVNITGYVGKVEFSRYMAASDIMISPSTNDGTSMTLLEAMAWGTFPIVGDIESNREWISHGENGYLVDPGDAEALATGVCDAVGNPSLRSSAARLNRQIVEARADYATVMPRVENFYREIIERSGRSTNELGSLDK